MIETALLFYRKNCKYSEKLIIFLKKYTKNLYLVENENNKAIKNIKKIKKRKYDYIFCFRSFYILKKDLLSKAKIAAINFHPGPPNYRGIGCLNYAIYEGANLYGSTCHIIDEKIDNGKIIDVMSSRLNEKSYPSNSIFQKETHLIDLHSNSLGDTIAIMPFLDLYSNKNNVDVYLRGNLDFNKLFEAASTGDNDFSSFIKSAKCESSSSPIGVSKDTGS